MFWLGVIIPIACWLNDSLITYLHLTVEAMTGPWFLLALAVAFCLGAALPIRSLFCGLAVSLSVSSAVAVAQALGWTGIVSWNHPAGFLYNSAVHAVAIALVIAALFAQRDYHYIWAMLPGLALAQSRGGYLVLAVGIGGRMFGWPVVIVMLAAASAVSMLVMGSSDLDRLTIWSVTWPALDWVGHGAGSFGNVLYHAGGALHFPGKAHNDYLQFSYEFGLMAIPLYLVYAVTLARPDRIYWASFAAFAVAGLFFFPFYTPVTGFIGAVLAGHILMHDLVRNAAIGLHHAGSVSGS